MRNILVVDDDPLLLKGTARIMEKAGYQTVTASNGKEALDALEQQGFDLVLLDVDLPDINGREVCKRIRQNPRCKGLYVIMVSSTRIAPDDKVLGLEGGADGYIARPVSNSELLSRVKAFLRLRSMEAAQRQAEAQQAELRKKESIVQISSGIAHDFNNLLAIIIGNIDLALMDLAPTHPATEPLVEAVETCQRASAITRKLLTLSEGIGLDLRPGNLLALIDTVVAGLPLRDDIRLRKDVQNEMPMVCFDADHLRQAIFCLMTNAIEAMPGGGTLTVRLSTPARDRVDKSSHDGEPTNGFVALSIEDTGRGISGQDQPKVFDPYFSTKRMGRQKGMGLGLSTANAIVALHDGRIELVSEIDKGTRATIFLPVSEHKGEKEDDECAASVGLSQVMQRTEKP